MTMKHINSGMLILQVNRGALCYLFLIFHPQGCLTAVPLAFILPTASYIKLSGRRWYSRDKILAFIVMVFGVMTMLIGTGLAVADVSW